MRPILAILLILATSLACRDAAATAMTADESSALPADSASLEPSSEPPWRPAKPIPARRTWEQALTAPGRIASLPLTGLGRLVQRGLLHLEERGKLPTGPTQHGAPQFHPIAVQQPGLGDRAGLGAGLIARAHVLSGRTRSFASARYAATLLGYNGGRVVVTGQPLEVMGGFDWRPQDQFFGIGRETSPDSITDFAVQREYARATLRWGWDRTRDRPAGRRLLGVWAGTRSQVTLRGREDGRASVEERFPVFAANTLGRRVDHLVYGASLSWDGRAGRPHWSRGQRIALSAERYDDPVEALALHSASPNGARFDRVEIQAEAGASIMRDPRTLRVMARVVDLDVRARPERLMISDLATLGGSQGLSGYSSGRFHDVDLLHTRVSYLFPIQQTLEIDLHAEWGAVYPDVWRDASLGSLRHSVGVSLRGRGAVRPFAAIGVDVSPESTRLSFSLGGVQ